MRVRDKVTKMVRMAELREQKANLFLGMSVGI